VPYTVHEQLRVSQNNAIKAGRQYARCIKHSTACATIGVCAGWCK
jgi:hypothetical protein